MLINVGYDIGLEFSAPTPVVLLLDIHQSRLKDLADETSISLTPDIEMSPGLDAFGNRYRRFNAPAGRLSLSYRAVVSDHGLPDSSAIDAGEVPVGDLPDYAIQFLLGSRYCETDALSAFAWQTFGAVPPGGRRVQAICDFVHDRIRFDYQLARSTRTAANALEEGVGVCRDYAHLAVALCRALNIPARYVNGYLGDIGVPKDPAPMDFSAWFEAYLGHRWWTFDARHNKPRIGRIVIARGRDAADVAMITSFGPHVLNEFHVVADEVGVAPAPAKLTSPALNVEMPRAFPRAA